MGKYRNKKTEVDNIMFASKHEADHYCKLKLEIRNGDITDLSLQPRFLLLEKGTNAMGKKYRKIEYVADFKYFDVKEGLWVIEDVKGMRTPVYKLKIKLFYAKYPEYYFQEV